MRLTLDLGWSILNLWVGWIQAVVWIPLNNRPSGIVVSDGRVNLLTLITFSCEWGRPCNLDFECQRYWNEVSLAQSSFSQARKPGECMERVSEQHDGQEATGRRRLANMPGARCDVSL